VASVTVQVGRRRSLTGTSPGVSTASGLVSDRRLLVGVQPAVGTSTVNELLTAYRRLVAASSGAATCTVILTRVRYILAASVAGYAIAVGQPGKVRLIVATAVGRATISGKATALRSLGPVTAPGQTLVVVIIGRKRTITPLSSVPGVAVTTAKTTARRSLAGSPQGIASVSATISVYLGLQHVLWEYHGAQFVFPPSPGLHEVIWVTEDDHFVLDPNPSELVTPGR